MQFKLFYISATGDQETEEELNRFLRSHRAVSVQRELVQSNSGATWCFCVEYLLGAPPAGEKSGGRRRIDYKEILSEENFAVFAQLRDVRKELAANEAIPVYAICTNEHLAEMAKTRPATLVELKKIQGFGEAKAMKYGMALLKTIQTAAPKQIGGGDATCRTFHTRRRRLRPCCRKPMGDSIRVLDASSIKRGCGERLVLSGSFHSFAERSAISYDPSRKSPSVG